MNFFFVIAFTLCLSACDFSCGTRKADTKIPDFNADFAFEKILQYEKLGPKVPGTKEHQNAGNWIVSELSSLNLKVLEQKAEAVNFNNNKIPIRNIIASFQPDFKKRVLLSAHWDNRPKADQDTKNKTKPILGVNDGGSGVAVLLGIAKAISKNNDLKNNKIGVDFAFWDAEDSGDPSKADSYCLGSQYWSKNLIPENYKAEYGINFDMVGRIGSVFPIENYSLEHAAPVIKKIQDAAKKLGYQDFFPNYRIGPIVDDHYFVTENTNIPMVDLIYMTPEGHFPPEWHTHDDTSEFISRDILRVVGQTTIQVIFNSNEE